MKPAETPPPRRTMGPVVVVVMLTLLLGIQPVSTDIDLPALATLRTDLGASMSAAQLTLSALIIAFGRWPGRHLDGTVYPWAWG